MHRANPSGLWLVAVIGGAILGGNFSAAQAPVETKASSSRAKGKAAVQVNVIAPSADGSAATSLELTLGQQPTDQVTLQLGERPAVARDDGQEGDRQAGDGVFTTRVDRGQAQRFENFAELTNRGGMRFDGRTLQTVSGTSNDRCGSPPLPPTGLSAHEEQRLIDQALMIVDTSVVDSAEAQTGTWSFGHLMTELANQETTGITPSMLTDRWLSIWLKDQPVNQFSLGAVLVAKRDNMQVLVLDPWREASAGRTLDLSKAPMRLLAIVFRLDLRSNLVLGPAPQIGGGAAGELRFVYGVVDRQQQQQPFTIIFEYQVRRENFAAVLTWARQVYGLYQQFDRIDSDEYRTSLKRLTTSITRRNADSGQLPNGSLLAQIRTNENALNRVWELREFRLDSGNSGYLTEVTTKQTPDLHFNGQARLADFIRQHESDLSCDMHVIPVEFEKAAFLAGSALNPPDEETPTEATLFWHALGLDARFLEARHRLSLATCNGCHGGETKSSRFLHIAPRDVGERSMLSAFLTGVVVPDPAGQMEDGHVKSREFSDLARRARDLKALIDHQEAYEVSRPVLQMVH
jgi:hypothetical protein